MTLADCLDQLDFERQMLSIVGRDAAQFIEQFRRDRLGFAMCHPVHNPVSHGFDRGKGWLRFEPIKEKSDGRPVIARGDGMTFLGLSGRISGCQSRAAETDAIDFAGQQPPQRLAPVIQREPYAR